MYNKIILMGNLTRDVEIRYSQSGSAIGSTGIAVNRKWKTTSGEQKEEVMFVDLTFFGRTAEVANQYLRKGSNILVDGRLSLEQWRAQDGSKKSKHAVVVENLQMIGGREGAQAQKQQDAPAQTPQGANPPRNDHPQQMPQQKQAYEVIVEVDEDEIPF